MNRLRVHLSKISVVRYFSEVKQQLKTEFDPVSDIKRIRNIGILAHIDGGKTTTTERMLFYSGTIHTMGEVHRGNTVTDYMEQERTRGITITSAAVSFDWANHKFNLIDTPGHIDFTIEVERTLNVLDGAIVILDGSAGVEAQTLTVWRQADRYGIPRIVFANKMDRVDASLEMTLESLNSKLNVLPLAIQLPVYDAKKKLTSIVDLITMNQLSWNVEDKGKSYIKVPLTPEDNTQLWEISIEARNKLIDQLVDLDDDFANTVIQQESMESVASESVSKSLHRVALSQKGVVVLCGSAYKNIGVQPLMDAVIQFLPSPDHRNTHLTKAFEDNLCARAFKIIHDDQNKDVTFLRIYSGRLRKNQRVYNIQRDIAESINKLMVVYADETREVSEINNGNIAAVSGLKTTITGDFLTASASIAARARKKLESLSKDDVMDRFGIETVIPDPVFFCSVEPSSQAFQQPLENALKQLQREDPSLRVSQNAETGQTILAGMGELHIDVVKNRLITDYKLHVDLGPLQIAYKEAILKKTKETHFLQHKIGHNQHHVKITMSLNPATNRKGDILIFDRSPESASNIDAIHPKYLQPLKQGVASALAHGPKLRCPVIDVTVTLHWAEIGKGTSETFVTAAVSQCIKKLLNTSGTVLLEPLMNLEIVTSSEFLSVVLADLSRRRLKTQEVTDRGTNRVVSALVPLVELLDFATDLRTITSGTASFSMEFHSYKTMTSSDENKAIESVMGFAV